MDVIATEDSDSYGDEIVPTLGFDGTVARKRDFRYSLSFLPHERRYTIDAFSVNPKVLGEGKFGKVFRARERSSRQVLVLKTMEKEAIQYENVELQIRSEIEIHSRLKHPNIINMYGYFQDAERLYLMMELANGGSLYEKLQTIATKRIPEAAAANIVFQVCKGLEYLHRLNVVHRDLKPENILITKDATGKEIVKLADFGWSVVMRDDSRRFTMCGTVEYLPPEVAIQAEYSFGFDMWTVGVLAYEMLVGHSPFAGPGASEDSIMENIQQCKYSFPAFLSEGAQSFIRQLLVSESDRMSPTAALKHPWIEAQCGKYAMQKEVADIKVPCVAPWKDLPGKGPLKETAKVMPASAIMPDENTKPVSADTKKGSSFEELSAILAASSTAAH